MMLKSKFKKHLLSAICLGLSGVSMEAQKHPFVFIDKATAPEMLGNINARVNIYDTIGTSWWEEGITAKAFIQQLSMIDDAADIDCHVSTDGGCTKEGTAMYNALISRKGKTNVVVDGYAMSMGSVLAMAGKNSGGTTKMVETGFLFLHKPISDMSSSNATEMRARADQLDEVEAALLLPYTQASGKSDDEVRALLAANTWMGATQALELGFIDEILGQEPAIAAAFDSKNISMYGEVPAEFLAKFVAKDDDDEDEDKDAIDNKNDDDDEEEEKDSKMSASDIIAAERKRCVDIQNMCDKNAMSGKASMFIAKGFSLAAASDFVLELKVAVDEEIVNRGEDTPKPKISAQSGNWAAAHKAAIR
jgi:ATP-dependent protease ClpP protease subunit